MTVHHCDSIFSVLQIQSMVEQCPADDADTEINLGCLLYKVRNNIIISCEKYV